MVGPGRGSAVGSLVAYALNITSIDPLQYHLLFERFLNVNRATMPDIDIDFQDDRRNEVVQYLFTRYPNTQVAHIIIFQKIKAKMALRDAGRVLNVNKSIIDLISKTIDSFDERRIGAMLNDNPALKEYQQKYPDLFNLADQLCGLVRQIGLHAAGMVISESGLGTLVPVFLNDGVVSTQFSMEYLEMLGIIKVDLLGLINLTIIQKTLDLIKNVNHHQLTCATIPLDDLTTFKYISTGKTDGIFQLASPPMRNILKRLQPRNIEDISTVIALYRPGALKYINELIDHRRNPQKIQYLKPSFAPILSFTYGIVIYQEQLMDLIRLAGNYSYAQADIFRRIITKKKPQELIKLRDDFMAKTIANGYAKEDAQQIFQFIENFAGYGFNHSHSIAYAYISY
jgi:DNA polymerase-3 subunit alpha